MSLLIEVKPLTKFLCDFTFVLLMIDSINLIRINYDFGSRLS